MELLKQRTNTVLYSVGRVLALTGILVGVVSLLPGMAVAQGGQAPSTPPTAPAQTKTVLPNYKVNPGDEIDINVYQKPELSKQVTIPPDGKFYYHFAGEILAAGKTLGEIKDLITTALAKELVSPQVTVSILKRQSYEVSLLGAVKNPGKKPLQDNWRILDLVVECGGLLAPKPEWVNAILVRGGGAESLPINMVQVMTNGDPKQNLLLQAGDILLINEIDSNRVSLQVLGEVTKPGAVIAPKDGSFASVISAVDGFKPRASTSEVTLERDGKTLTIDLHEAMTTGKAYLVDPTKKGVKEEVKAQAGDKIIVRENKLLYSVLGSVFHPGPIEFPESGAVTVLTALSLAGGTSPNADLKNAVLLRPTANGPEGQPVNLQDLLKNSASGKKNDKAAKGVDVAMLPGDVLFIPERKQGGANFGTTMRDALSFLPFFTLFGRR